MVRTKRPRQASIPVPAEPLSVGPSRVRAPRFGASADVLAFDPSVTLIRMPELLALTGLQRATVYKRLKDDPTFPKPVPLSDSTARGAPVAWVLAEVQEWVKSRIAARGKVAA